MLELSNVFTVRTAVSFGLCVLWPVAEMSQCRLANRWSEDSVQHYSLLESLMKNSDLSDFFSREQTSLLLFLNVVSDLIIAIIHTLP